MLRYEERLPWGTVLYSTIRREASPDKIRGKACDAARQDPSPELVEPIVAWRGTSTAHCRQYGQYCTVPEAKR